MSSDTETLLYDDFFSDPADEGVPVEVWHRGKRLEFKLRKSITLKERQLATDASIKISLDESGKPKLEKVDQSAFTTEVLSHALKSWPFKYRDGREVPINRHTVAALDSSLADKLVAQVVRQDSAQEEALDPFVQPSEED